MGFLITLGSLGISCLAWALEEPDLTVEFIHTDRPSSFPPLMWVHITNQAFTPLNLMDLVAASRLVIDGKPSHRIETSFDGPAGIPPAGNWEGCLSPDDYAPPLAAGKHKVSLVLGGTQSKGSEVVWSAPINWRQGTLQTRSKELRDVASSIKKGLPRSCVEQWLTVKDGGEQDIHRVRYFLEPQYKIIVSYENDVVHGPVKMYQESRLND